jgi:hypothetical protein
MIISNTLRVYPMSVLDAAIDASSAQASRWRAKLESAGYRVIDDDEPKQAIGLHRHDVLEDLGLFA